MKAITHEWIEIAEGDWATANREIAVDVNTNYRAVSFHSQQCGEKYLKAYLQEKDFDPQRTHDLAVLLNNILPFEPEWEYLRESCYELTEFAVEHRYPGTTTSEQEAKDALRYAGVIRDALRASFQLA